MGGQKEGYIVNLGNAALTRDELSMLEGLGARCATVAILTLQLHSGGGAKGWRGDA